MSFKTRRYPFFIGITTLVVIIVLTLTGLFFVDTVAVHQYLAKPE